MQLVVLDGGGPDGSIAFSDLLAADPLGAPIAVDPGTPALVGWTSGTTSSPKGVIHSHQTVCAEIAQLGATSPPSDRASLVANPISHAIGMLGALLIPVDRGKPVHLVDQWDPSDVLDLMVKEDLSAGGGAPYFLTSLLDHPGCSEEHLELLHYQGMGGAPVPRAVMERGTEIGLMIYSMYGSTEHPSITGCTYADPLDKRLASAGRPLPGCEIKLVDPEGLEVKAGEPGEILSRGPECFLGYTDAALTAKVFDQDGWYHTGDVGVLDPDGYLSITDRISDVIIRGGENISAAEVEEVLMTFRRCGRGRRGRGTRCPHGRTRSSLSPHGRRTASARPAGAAQPLGGGGCGPSEMAGGADPCRGLPADLNGEGPKVRAARSPPRRSQLGEGDPCRFRCRTRSQKSSIQHG